MKFLSRENQAEIIEVFNSNSRYFDDSLNIDNVHFEQMIDRIYPAELQLNKANSSDTEAPFPDLNLLYLMVQFLLKIINRKDFDFGVVNFAMSLGVLRMECTYLNLFLSLEHLLGLNLATLIVVTKP